MRSRFTTRPEILGAFGVVASTHWLASAAGMAILERGGNAFDAAAATALALQVVEPHLNGPGGEVPLLLAPSGGAPVVICGQGVAPAAADLDAYRSLDLAIVPGSGLLAAVTPGAFDALMLTLRDYGTLRLREVFEHCLSFAERGYPLVPNISNTIAAVEALFRDEWTSSAAVYLPGGAVPAAGGLFRNPALAATYRRILAEAEAASADRVEQIEAARRAWAEGFVAEAVDRFFRTTAAMDTTGRRHRGFLTGDDMARWRATKEAPATLDYGAFTVCKTGPWGQGPVFLQQLAMLRGVDFSGLDALSPDFVHIVVETTKLAFADREAFYGDPDFVDVPLDRLLSEDYAAERRALIDASASHEVRPGSIPGYGGPVPVRPKGASAEAGAAFDIGEPTVARFDEPTPNAVGGAQGDTCHFDIVDQWGNMVAATPSGGWLQSSPVIPELGFCLSNRAQMFWLDAASPACIAPGKRPRSTLTPSLALRDGAPYLAFGTPGGDQQDQWSLHFFLRHVHFGLNLQEAIDAPGFHTEHFPNSFFPRETNIGHLAVEGRFPASAIDALRRRGHELVVEDDWSLGRLTAAAKDGALLRAAANPRFMQGYAIGR